MLKYFSTPPKISLKCESYHYERYTYTTIDSDGNTSTQTQTQKIVTHVETIDFQYYSERDVSGLFYLNCDEASIKYKSFIKLELIDELILLMQYHIRIMISQKELFMTEIVIGIQYVTLMKKE